MNVEQDDYLRKSEEMISSGKNYDTNTKENFLTQNASPTSRGSKRRKKKHKQVEEVHKYKKKNRQLKEQLRVQQKLMTNKENAEGYVQEQLNKVTIECTQLKLMRDELINKLKQANGQIKFQNQQISKLKACSETGDFEKNKEITSLNHKLTRAYADIEDLKHQVVLAKDKMKNEKSRIKKQSEQYQKKIQDLIDININIENKAKSVEADFEGAKIEFTNQKQMYLEMQVVDKKHKEQIDKLTEENELLKSDIEKLLNLNGEDKKTIDKLKNDIDYKEKQIAVLSAQLKESNTRTRRVSLSLQDIESKHENVFSQIEESKKLEEQKIHHLGSEIESLKQQLLAAQESNAKLKRVNEKEHSERKKTKAELKKAILKIEDLKTENENCMRQITQLKSELQSTSTEKDVIDSNLSETNRTLDKITSEIDEYEAKVKELVQDNACLQKTIDDLKEKAYIEQLNITHKDHELNKLKNDSDSLKQENEELQNKICALQDIISDLEARVSSSTKESEIKRKGLDDALSQLQIQSDKTQDALKEIKTQNESLKELRIENATLKGDLTKARSEIHAKISEISHLKDIINQKQINQQKLMATNSELLLKSSQTQQQLRNEMNTVESHSEEIKMLNQEIKDLKKENYDVSHKLTLANTEINELKSRLNVIETDRNNMQSIIAENTESRNVAEIQLQDYIERYQMEAKKAEMSQINSLKLQTELTEVNSEVKNLRKLNNQLKQEVSEMNVVVQQLTMDIGRKKDHIDQLESELDIVKQERDRLILKLDEISKRPQNIEACECNTSQIFENISKSELIENEKFRALEEDLKDKLQVILEQRNKISDLNLKIEKLELANESKSDDIFTLNQKIKDDELLITLVKSQNEELKSTLAKVRSEKRELAHEIDKMEKQYTTNLAHMELESKIALDIARNNLEQNIDVIKTSEKYQKEKVIVLQKERDELIKELRGKNMELTELKISEKNLKAKLSSRDEQIHSVQQTNDDLHVNLLAQIQSSNKHEVTVQNLTHELESAKDRIQVLNKNIAKLADEKFELTKQVEELSLLKLSLETYKAQNETLTHQNRFLENSNEELIVTNKELENEIHELKHKIYELESMTSPHSPKKTNNSLLSNQQLLSELAVLRSLVNNNHDDISKLVGEKESLTSTVQNLRRLVNNLQIENEKMGLESSNNMIKSTTLSEELRRVNCLNSKYCEEISVLSSSVENLRNALSITKNQLKTSDKEKSELKSELNKTKIALEDAKIGFI